ncbi:hypothetical protein [Vibrio sp. J502]|uniref:hypothetical protein n=1 Tax=Vibrio sp. J502 TaxID=2978741 RepID=UPI0039655C78
MRRFWSPPATPMFASLFERRNGCPRLWWMKTNTWSRRITIDDVVDIIREDAEHLNDEYGWYER